MSTPPAPTQAPIASHALLADGRTAALVSLDGRVDWLCLPRFDSEAVFASLLGTPEHGEWLLRPRGVSASRRRYLPDSLVLRTTHEVEHDGRTGTVELTEFMPVHGERADLVRTSYGAVRPWVRRDHDAQGREVLVAVAGPDKLALHGDPLPTATDSHHAGRIVLTEGEEVTFRLTWLPAWADLAEDTHSWAVQRAMLACLEEHWRRPDNGIWEIRGHLRHLTHSRVMVWAAFDAGDDPRVVGTIRAVEEDLSVDGLVLRYRTEFGVDGLSGEEPPSSSATSGWSSRGPWRVRPRRPASSWTASWGCRTTSGSSPRSTTRSPGS
ncbi:trehalase-like domain-containing protein [Kytococcus sp. Marseille-QA3725]